jgi:hypothetical protein
VATGVTRPGVLVEAKRVASRRRPRALYVDRMSDRDGRAELRSHLQWVESEIWSAKGSAPEGWFRAVEDDGHAYGYVNIRTANAIRLVPANEDSDRYRIRVFFSSQNVDLRMGPYLHNNAIDVLDSVLRVAHEGYPER